MSTPIRLPRFPSGWQNTQPQLFERYWDEAMFSIEKNLNALLSLPLIEQAVIDAQTAADTAQTAADAATTAADAASTAALASATEASLVNSFPSTVSPPILSVASTGTITIFAHQRVYGDSSINPTVSVAGGSLVTGGTSGQVLRVYYDDPTRAGGAVTYLWTVDPAAPPVQGNNRHSVGVVTVPGAGSSDGSGVKPPGYVEP